jgi:hypothetical protein
MKNDTPNFARAVKPGVSLFLRSDFLYRNNWHPAKRVLDRANLFYVINEFLNLCRFRRGINVNAVTNLLKTRTYVFGDSASQHLHESISSEIALDIHL